MKLSRKEMNRVQINGEYPDIITFQTSKLKAIEIHFCGCSFWKNQLRQHSPFNHNNLFIILFAEEVKKDFLMPNDMAKYLFLEHFVIMFYPTALLILFF